MLVHQGFDIVHEGLRLHLLLLLLLLWILHLALHRHARLHARMLGRVWGSSAGYLSGLVPLLRRHVACGQITQLLLLRLEPHGVCPLCFLLSALQIL